MRSLLSISVALSCLATAGCFEEPVREHVHITMIGGGAAVLTTVQDVAAPWQAGSNPELAGRLDDARSELGSGWDRWRPLYDELRPVAERYSIELVDQLVRRATYGAVVPFFAPVGRFLGAEGLSASFSQNGSVAEIQLYPSGGSRATWRQRQEVEAELDLWAATVADYLHHAVALYAYLEGRPDRAAPCLAHVVDVHEPDFGSLTDHEQRLVTDLKPAMEAVADILLVPEDRAFSLNELSRLAFDPFPARLTISVDGPVLQTEGLLVDDGHLERPRVDLWSALIALDGRWLSPDLVTAMVAPAPEDRQPEVQPELFASRPRRFGRPPEAGEVAEALRSRLIPPDMHVVRWRPVAMSAPDFEATDPRRYLDAAATELSP
jgi:hypothetical protein